MQCTYECNGKTNKGCWPWFSNISVFSRPMEVSWVFCGRVEIEQKLVVVLLLPLLNDREFPQGRCCFLLGSIFCASNQLSHPRIDKKLPTDNGRKRCFWSETSLMMNIKVTRDYLPYTALKAFYIYVHL